MDACSSSVCVPVSIHMGGAGRSTHMYHTYTSTTQGVLNKPTLSGTYTLAVIYEGAQLYSHSGNVCGEEQASGWRVYEYM